MLAIEGALETTGVTSARQDSRFAGLDGSGVTTVVIDTGIDLDNSFFGPDSNHDGIDDRIVFQYDFADGDADASDRLGHGSHVASLIGSQDARYSGVAPGAELIALKVFSDSGSGNFGYLEKALQWVIANQQSYHIGVVNLSLGDGGNWTNDISRYGLGDEFAALSKLNVIVIAAAGNNYYQFGQLGVAYPAADPAVIAVGSTWAGDFGGPWKISTGAIDYTTGVDRISAFSQRDDELLDVFAPGARFNGAYLNGTVRTMQGTSQASAFASGVATLAQQLAQDELGRSLTTAEFAQLLKTSSDWITDGDDENDNVPNTGLRLPRINFQTMAEQVLAMGDAAQGDGTGAGDGGGNAVLHRAAAGVHTIQLEAGENAGGNDFGNFQLGSISGVAYEDRDGDGARDADEAAQAGWTVFLDADGNGVLDTGETNVITGQDGSYSFLDLGPGTYHVREVVPVGWQSAPASYDVLMTSGLAAAGNDFGNHNLPATASPDSYTTDEDTPLVVAADQGVLVNDSDLSNDALIARLVRGTSHGRLVLNSDGGFTYTPNANYNGSDSFIYKANDGTSDSNPATVTITVNPVNDAPVAVNDQYSTSEDTALVVAVPGVLRNDRDVEGDPLTARLASAPAHGNVTLNADGSFTYTPEKDYNGADSFTYVANDGQADSNQATVAITVRPVNDAPVAAADSYSTDEDTPLVVAADQGVLANDRDVDGDALFARLISSTAHGRLVLNSDGSLTYTPYANYAGGDSFAYKASDGKLGSNTATVTITVNPVNHPPVATDDKYSTSENKALVVVAAGVLKNDRDVDGDPLTARLVNGPAHGSVTLNADGSFTYTPDAYYNGADSFTYVANDGMADSTPATVAITVTAVNYAPVAAGDSYSTNEETPLVVAADQSVLVNDSDPDGDALTARLIRAPAHGTLALNSDGSFTYTPNAGFIGGDSFTYKASDGKLGSNTATVAITVNQVNFPPVATDDSYSTPKGTALVVAAEQGVLVNDSDPNSDALTARLVRGTSHGRLVLNSDGSFTYTPNAGFIGGDSFTYKASDGKLGSNTATVAITVNPVNNPPIAVDDKYSISEDKVLAVAAAGVLRNDRDVDGDALTAALVNAPAHGSVMLNADGSFTYTPDKDYNSADSFTYVANDGTADSAAATVAITVNPVNDPPVAVADSYSTPKGTALVVAADQGVLANDSDVEGDALTARLINNPAHGRLVLNPDGSFTYTPYANYTGGDSFTYKASDGKLGSNTATVSITVLDLAVMPTPTLQAQAATGTLTMGSVVSLNNIGTVDVQSGSLYLSGGDITDTGTINVGTNAAWELGGGTYALDAGALWITSGSGVLQVSGGTLNANIDTHNGALELSGGAININSAINEAKLIQSGTLKKSAGTETSITVLPVVAKKNDEIKSLYTWAPSRRAGRQLPDGEDSFLVRLHGLSTADVARPATATASTTSPGWLGKFINHKPQARGITGPNAAIRVHIPVADLAGENASAPTNVV